MQINNNQVVRNNSNQIMQNNNNNLSQPILNGSVARQYLRRKKIFNFNIEFINYFNNVKSSF